MELISMQDAPALFGVGRTQFMTLKKFDPNFPPVRGQKGRCFAFDLIELAEYFSKKKPRTDAPGFQLALAAVLKSSQPRSEA